MHDRTFKQNPAGWILGIAVWALLAWSAMRPPAISNEPLFADNPPPASGRRKPAVTPHRSPELDQRTTVSTLPGFEVQEIYRLPAVVDIGPGSPTGVVFSGGDASHPYFPTWRRLPAADLQHVAAVTRRAQDAAATLARAHAHNDYRHKRPLLDALAHGFGSVEADIHLKDGKLLVGHDAWELRPERTLQAMYLDPLRAGAKQNGGRICADTQAQLTLLVDIKTDGPATYRVLRDVLADYDDLLAGPVRKRRRDARQNGNADHDRREPAVVVVVSGNRPKQAIEQNKDRRVGIDGRVGDLDSDAPADLVPLISDNWRSHFRWRGEGPMPEAERAKLRTFVAQAHAKGRRIRFWATPEKEAVWRELQDAGVDLIGTDDLARLATFLRQ